MSGVQMGPGATALTRMCFSASAWAKDRVKETMAPFVDDEQILRNTFARTRRLFDLSREQIADFHAEHVSMGMSNDFEIAIEEGSTMVRLGTILFGERAQ